MPDDDYKAELLFYKSIQSYKGIFPSKDFNEYEYSLYLQYASSYELEHDILESKTYDKIKYNIYSEEEEEIIDDKIRRF
jgi:hypothetical protein